MPIWFLKLRVKKACTPLPETDPTKSGHLCDNTLWYPHLRHDPQMRATVVKLSQRLGLRLARIRPLRQRLQDGGERIALGLRQHPSLQGQPRARIA